MRRSVALLLGAALLSTLVGAGSSTGGARPQRSTVAGPINRQPELIQVAGAGSRPARPRPLIVDRDLIRPPIVDEPAVSDAIPVTRIVSRKVPPAASAPPLVDPRTPLVASHPAVHRAPNPPTAGTGSNVARDYAHTLVVDPAQWLCLDQLWGHESHWRTEAHNSESSAAGVAELLTETSKDPHVQVDNGLAYIRSRYGSACKAWAFWKRQRMKTGTGWY